MDIDGLFQSPAKYLSEFARIQTLLYREDPALQDYFMQLQMDIRTEATVQSQKRGGIKRLVGAAIHGVGKAAKLLPRKEIKVDVLYCPMPYFGRKTENRFLIQVLVGLVQTEATILCLMPNEAPCREEIESRLHMMGRRSQVQFIDPMALSNSVQACVHRRGAQNRGRKDFERSSEILKPYGLSPTCGVREGFEHIAGFAEAWELLAPQISFGAVVARCHWHALCSSVCRTALKRGKAVATFQQGVIGHTLDAPITASTYVAFGQASSSFLTKMNNRFLSAASAQESRVSFVNGGCLYDKITRFPDQFERQTILLVDVPMAQGEFYGVEDQCSALMELAARLLASAIRSCRVIFRPHPYWNNLNFDACQLLARNHPERCELSHPAWSLEDDLSRSSVVIGVFSGVLTVASACGLPTIFLQTQDGYVTGDLECFSPDQTLLPDEALRKACSLLKDRDEYARARTIAMRNGENYYTDGKNLKLTREFFDSVLGRKMVADNAIRPIQ
jgi:hypothetical protein